MPVSVECTKRTFKVLALLTKNCNVFFSDTVTLIPFVFLFLFTETSHQKSILLILSDFSDNMSLEYEYRIARFVICNYIKGGGSRS